MKVRQRPTKKARIEIIPMIDVIFFLLVFFMVSSLAMTKVNSVPVTLPKTDSSPQALKQAVILTVNNLGAIFVNKVPVTMELVGATLANAMNGHLQVTVVVNADEKASYGLVVKVMNQARQIGVRKFALATEASGKPQ